MTVPLNFLIANTITSANLMHYSIRIYSFNTVRLQMLTTAIDNISTLTPFQLQTFLIANAIISANLTLQASNSDSTSIQPRFIKTQANQLHQSLITSAIYWHHLGISDSLLAFPLQLTSLPCVIETGQPVIPIPCQLDNQHTLPWIYLPLWPWLINTCVRPNEWPYPVTSIKPT